MSSWLVRRLAVIVLSWLLRDNFDKAPFLHRMPQFFLMCTSHSFHFILLSGLGANSICRNHLY